MNDKNNNCLMCKYFWRDDTEKPCCDCEINSGFVRSICSICSHYKRKPPQDYPCNICDDRNSHFEYSGNDLKIKETREMDLQEKLDYISIVGEMILNYAKDYPDVASFMLKNKIIKTDAKGLSVEIILRKENK